MFNAFCAKGCDRPYGVAYSVSIGGFVAPELAIVGLVSGVTGAPHLLSFDAGPDFFTQKILAVGARYRPVRILALSAAFGAGRRSFIDDDFPPGDPPLWGPAGMLEVALTFARRGPVHFAIFARVEHGRYERFSATSTATGLELALW